MNRILYVNTTSIHGGAEDALLQMMLVARLLGYDPVLVVPRPGWLTDCSRSAGIPCELLPSLPDIMKTKTSSEQFVPWLTNGIAIAQLVRKWHACIVHSNSTHASYHGSLGARLTGVGAITHTHDIVDSPFRSPIKARLLTTLSDWILVPSQAVERIVSTYVPRVRHRIKTIYYGWDPSTHEGVRPADVVTEFGVSANKLIIGSVSTMTPWKGQDVLIDAFRLLYAENSQLHLIIVGSSQSNIKQDAYEQFLHEKVANYGLQNAVTFTGWREDSWSFIRRFDIFVHVPTKPDPLPTVVLHASALGATIVGSAIGGIPEIIVEGQSGLLVPPGDPETLAVTLKTLLANPDLRKQLGEAARVRFRQRFTQQQMGYSLQEIYRLYYDTQVRSPKIQKI